MTGLVERTRQRVTHFMKKWEREAPARRFMAWCRRLPGSVWSNLRKSRRLHPATRRYIRFNRELWGTPPATDQNGVFLVGLYPWFPCMPGYAHFANHFAGKASASIEWYNFYPRREREFEQIYRSFGARPGLTLDLVKVDEERAKQSAQEIFSQLRTKWDVIAIEVDGLQIGDLIYDTYLRVGPYPTVDITDPRLAEIILYGVRIARSCLDYFSKKKVIGIIPDHFTYVYSGIITRCALLAGVPVYEVCYGPHFVAFSVSIGPDKRLPARFPYAQFHRMFAQLTAEEREAAREKGRRVLQRRFAGHEDGLLAIGGSIYGEAVVKSAYSGVSSEAVMETTGRPRILVMLHDFCDAVHCIGPMLFPDFYEWIHCLLKHASETEFDWYVKPHPNSAREGVIARVTGGVLAELKSQYPRIRFLQPTTSSRQIIQEGVSAMFTGYGTAGHEFAYHGVPVVNAGENPHMAYDFNLHPQTVEEYLDCIAHADSLKVNIHKEDIEEYIYMNYMYNEERLSSDANPMSKAFLESDEYKRHRSRPETLEWLMYRLGEEEKAELARYFDRLPHVSEPLSVNVRAGKTQQPEATILSV
ncbi:MAG TPA: hypothetical protein VK961_02070 [Chthoniobacter sp.]|nr:hypothetical protein [Chthoniobacter sp.]